LEKGAKPLGYQIWGLEKARGFNFVLKNQIKGGKTWELNGI